jgi:hypothetical protein
VTGQGITAAAKEERTPGPVPASIRASDHTSGPSASPSSRPAPRRPSRFLLRFFDLYLSLHVPFHFRALRISHPERFPLTARPLIVVINHPSWWDPLTSILLSRFFLRDANHYAPIDSISLPRNNILAGLGLFPVEQGTPRGAVQFLRAAQCILSDSNSLLWLTPQGGFTDVRPRPVVFKSGLASLIKRLDDVTVLPFAYEYTYWDERLPEILTNCGQPLLFRRGLLTSESLAATPEQTDPGASIAAALASTQDELSNLAATRNLECFHTVMGGHTGVGFLRGMWLNFKAAIFPHPYSPPAAGPLRIDP